MLQRAVALGVNFIDTADAYGPDVSETLIAAALHPYPDDLVIATKGGLSDRPGRGRPTVGPNTFGPPATAVSRLRLEQIPLYQFHRPDPDVPLAESIGTLVELKDEGKIRHIGVCNFDEAQLRERKIIPVVSLQNRYNATDRSSESLIDLCEQEAVGVPAVGADPRSRRRRGRSRSPTSTTRPATGRLAWLLGRSSAMLPIPGTGSVSHLESNISAASVELRPRKSPRSPSNTHR